MGARASKALRPATRTVENTQDLDRDALQSVRHDERRPWNHELPRSRNATRPPHFWALGQQRLDIVNDVERNTLCGCRIILLDVGAQRSEVVDGLGRPDRS
jgi:hypothetical protein